MRTMWEAELTGAGKSLAGAAGCLPSTQLNQLLKTEGQSVDGRCLPSDNTASTRSHLLLNRPVCPQCMNPVSSSLLSPHSLTVKTGSAHLSPRRHRPGHSLLAHGEVKVGGQVFLSEGLTDRLFCLLPVPGVTRFHPFPMSVFLSGVHCRSLSPTSSFGTQPLCDPAHWTLTLATQLKFQLGVSIARRCVSE